ncbi:MAG: hypothetical protein ACRD8A_11085, partial [Candidatus Acidiferrales bacterium]
ATSRDRKPTVQLFKITDESNPRVPRGSTLFRTVGLFSLTPFDTWPTVSHPDEPLVLRVPHARFVSVGLSRSPFSS